jgi:hypothetical protein
MTFLFKHSHSAALVASAGLLLASLTACSTLNVPRGNGGDTSGETIGYSVGPCFGFCPVYEVEVTPAGHVAYSGTRNTAVIGTKAREAGTRGYRAIASVLAGYRPAEGTTAETQCEQRRTDQQHYVITWTKADGTKTVLQHDKGCMSQKNEALNHALDALPAKLGIADWTQQKTLPGATRG